jgi:para-aminobenzoate synthetase / 4-amino-4-deoxychorismate lyase
MNLFCAFEHQPRWFSDPQDLVCCHSPSELAAGFSRMESWLRRGWHAAGFLSFEAGYAFEKKLLDERPRQFPLLLMGAYRRPQAKIPPVPRASAAGSIDRLHPNVSYPAYAKSIRAIREYIAAGDVYQITYALKLKFRFTGRPRALYASLLRRQPVPYPAFIESDHFSVLSLSPERFLRKCGKHMLAEPMKGTWPRGATQASDRWERRRFQHDPKNRAENVMIADLLRNDLGRVGNQIRVPKLFTVTPYRSLFQMTSTVTAQVPRDLPLATLFKALFPSGSVTGAPKIRAMQIIRELETEERHIYTGAIGYVTPARDLYFNVPIRTLLLRGSSGEMGIGGGIIWDSTARGEWEEGLLKARFLSDLATQPRCHGGGF